MLASLKFIERFITLPKVTQKYNINGKSIDIQTYDLPKITPNLTKQGFEIDSIIKKGEGLETVVIGKIEKTESHPNASKLQICQVNIGDKEYKQIVCGAKNAREGLYVAVALPSTILPNNIEIKCSKIREVESNGMLCSREELGLPVIKELDGDGIWEISEDQQGGKPQDYLNEYLGFPIFEVLEISDTLLEISVTPNRPDMLFHAGVAREIAAAFENLNIPYTRNTSDKYSIKNSIKPETVKNDAIKNIELKCGHISFSAENSIHTPAFFMLVDSVQVKPSPAWLRNLLENLGQNSINNIVDISNYLLLAFGQPSHAFDLEKLHSKNPNEKKIYLRQAIENEKFTGLDGKERTLDPSDQVISDIETTQGLLGVLGGEFSKVTKDTKKIVIEFANPHSVAVRRSSRRHARQTEASFMFEKGIDAAERFFAAAEYFALMENLQNIKPIYCGTVHSHDKNKKSEIKTEFPINKINFLSTAQEKILGANIIPFEKQLKILSSLGFELSNVTEKSALINVPTWRSLDIDGQADLVEEFIRIEGIDLVPATPMVTLTNVNYDDNQFKHFEKLSSRCTSLGYSEVISLHFMRSDEHKKLKLETINSLGEPVALLNPIIGDEPFLHTTLIPDLLRKIAKNLSYGNNSGQLFHICRTFQNRDIEGNRIFEQNNLEEFITTELKNTNIPHSEYHFKEGFAYTKEKTQLGRPVETPRLAGVVFGNRIEKNWQNTSAIKWTLHDIIAHVSSLLSCMECEPSVIRITDDKNKESEDLKFHPFAAALHPGRRVGIYLKSQNNEFVSVGWCGELHPQTMRNYEIDVPCLAFEINVSLLIKQLNAPKTFIKRTALTQKFPTVSRDFAFLINEDITAKEIQDKVRSSLENLLSNETPAIFQDLNIFDIYRGKGVPEDKKSIAFNIQLIPTERTFTEKDIQKISNTVIQVLSSEFKAELRG
ncbi:phenylalanine--tRNA ligase subunit beta [Pigmentibacter sp. JX0631]|uniref:phenylalanine--tRNA ligase subunit beta n=1 Tax=Pigmentibacter sp. JX0631 TaxID=2976982 RepID=UPI0024689D79|nr:phenylalanine--tRNA ligase subunit beta [Pigmentibacter sp. JX0631]WGL60866.1 phenylalanine--tRNA ligase subunit beta [Pigmentibacter sp. JX0631]